MANPTQRIPLRVLSEHTWSGPNNYQSGNHASAPSVGKPSGGSPISTQLDSFLVSNDSLTSTPSSVVNLNGLLIGPSQDVQFPNIPVTQNNATGQKSLTQPGNQTFPFTVPVGTIAEYYVWCCIESPPINPANGAQIAAIVMPYVAGYAVDASGIKYSSVNSNVLSGNTRIPTGATISQFRAKLGFNAFTTALLSFDFSIKVFAQLFLTYPSANPS